jgi:hypothetical protein
MGNIASALVPEDIFALKRCDKVVSALDLKTSWSLALEDGCVGAVARRHLRVIAL